MRRSAPLCWLLGSLAPFAPLAAVRAQPVAPPPLGTPAAPAVPPPPDQTVEPGMRVTVGQAPVVGGDAAGARERALDDALRQAVDQVLGEMLDPAARAAQAKTVKALLARARSYVPRYRTLEEGEANGVYTIRIAAEVYEIALRRKLEAGAAPPPAAAPSAPASLAVLAGDAQPPSVALSTGLVAALGALGVRAQPGSAPGAVAPASVRVLAAVTDEGEVRGTGRTSIACRGSAALNAPAAGPPADASAQARVFATATAGAGLDAGHADCVGHLASDLAAQLAGRLSSAGSGGADLRLVTVDADVTEPGAVPALLRSVRSLGVVSSAELTRVAGGRAEIRLRSRNAPGAIAAALARPLGPTLTLSEIEAAGDVIRLRARLTASATEGTP